MWHTHGAASELPFDGGHNCLSINIKKKQLNKIKKLRNPDTICHVFSFCDRTMIAKSASETIHHHVNGCNLQSKALKTKI